MRNLKTLLMVSLVLVSACESRDVILATDDTYKDAIGKCMETYKFHIKDNVLGSADRAYVFYANSNLIDVFFSHGDIGYFTNRSPDYEGLLYCGGVLNQHMQFEVTHLKFARSSKFIYSTQESEGGVVSANTCGIVKQRRYILNDMTFKFIGEKIFDCWR